MEKKLYRDEQRKTIAGVCAGLADYFNVDVSLVRLIFVLTLIFKGGGGMIYIVLWIVLPKKPFTFVPPVDYTVPPGGAAQPQQPFYQAPIAPAPKGPSTAAIIGGVVLILLGAGLLIDQLDIIPDWHFDLWWPGILVLVGVFMIFSGGKNKKVEWKQATPTPEAEPKKDTTSDNDPNVEQL
ncbi:PspC domain-containing protein [Mucilaginibacter sp. RS28]|uniref:PspC domain-containing protein n=1 Tax=Mucilaginibacter straminoryzae TaxID=2932774 RepID=A0A9X2BCM2_9SPHI|nr:PspC domain-containing protein [Mucilaginibacter straminoryzae]MCJ8209463.1 PspC domain-containing protein [Mucilaginibacter straminoryzae]